MEPKVLIVGTDINAYYMARCYHEIYHKKVDLIGRVAMSFTSLSTITNVNIIPNLIIQYSTKFATILINF